MKIVTVNCPESYIDAMGKLAGEGCLYPSRSELVRVAVRDFLINKLNHQDTMNRFDKENKQEGDPNIVKIPIAKIKINGKMVDQYKHFKILRKLENDDKEGKKPLMEYEKPRIKKEPIKSNIFWEEKEGNFRISKENPNLVFIEGIGLTVRINESQI